MSQTAIKILKEKIEVLLEAWAITADTNQKFALKKQIETAEKELIELEKYSQSSQIKFFNSEEEYEFTKRVKLKGSIQSGQIKFFNTEKGYGFIAPDDGSKDVFCHITSLPEGYDLYEGDKVFYEVENSPSGLNAKNVTPNRRS